MAGLDAFGITLEREDTPGGGVYTAIANIVEAAQPESEREAYDVTSHDSAGGWREHIGGLADAGEAEITVNYDPAVHATLRGDFEDSIARGYKFRHPNGTDGIDFKAFMTGWTQENPVDDKMSAEITLRATGKPVVV